MARPAGPLQLHGQGPDRKPDNAIGTGAPFCPEAGGGRPGKSEPRALPAGKHFLNGPGRPAPCSSPGKGRIEKRTPPPESARCFTPRPEVTGTDYLVSGLPGRDFEFFT